MKTYLSGEISKDQNYIEKFERFEKLIPGHVNNPIHFKPFLGIKIWPCYMITALKALFNCEAVYFIPDWKQSRGAKVEFWFARFLRKPCYQINPSPVKQSGIRIEENETHWVVFHRNQVTGRYDLKGIASKFQKLN